MSYVTKLELNSDNKVINTHTKSTKKRGRPAFVRDIVFDLIAHEGKQSATSIHNRLYPPVISSNLSTVNEEKKKSRYSRIHKRLMELYSEGLIGKVGTDRSNPGPPKILYQLTTLGLKKFVNRFRPSSYEFWKKIFLIFDESDNHKLNIQLDDIVSEFEDVILNISRDRRLELPIVKIFHDFKNQTQERKDFYDRVMPILEILGENGKSLEDELEKRVTNLTDTGYDHSDSTYQLKTRGLIATVYSGTEKERIGLTPFGILLLINHYYQQIQKQQGDWITNDDGFASFSGKENYQVEDKKLILNKIVKAILNNKYLLPRIFSNIQPKGITDFENIASAFSEIYFGQWPDGIEPDEATLFLFNSQQAMQREYNKVLKEEYDEGIRALKDWIEKTDCLYPILDENWKFSYGFRSNIILIHNMRYK
jgi:DNA-binding PadR family transcriptional regulator